VSEHRSSCLFGPGFYRIVLANGSNRYCQDERELRQVLRYLADYGVRKVQRDACLDPLDVDDGTRGVVDGEVFLQLSQADGMAALGVTSEADYVRAYRAIEEAIVARDRAVAHGGDRASVVIKKKGTAVSDV
jgi:hypothetical protein